MDTAQLAGAAETDPNVAIERASDAFKSFLGEEKIERPRDDAGRFAPVEETAEDEEEEAELASEPEDEAEEEDELEAADEAQPMPPSWPADEAEHWNTLPPETQAYLAKREGERETAVQAKFQESANARKAAEAVQAEANATRDEYAKSLDVVLAAIQGQRPDPRAFGAGTGQYDRESYDLALLQYEQSQQLYAQLFEQREAIQKQEQQEAEQSFAAWKQEREAVYAPKFLADMPELTDPTRAEPAMRALVEYALSQGIPPETFAEANQSRIDSAELHILWKAQQFDKLRSAKTEAKPKPASPAVKPGVSSPRSAQKSATRKRDFDRLARDGSVEAGAAVFKHFLR